MENEIRQVARIFLDVEPETHISKAIKEARRMGCDFVCFNDLLYPTDADVADSELPRVRVRYLRGQFERDREDIDDIEHARRVHEFITHNR